MEEKVSAIIDILKKKYPDPACALHYTKDYELMIAVRLSAQCTDARVNLVTPALFAAYPTLEAMASADITDVERFVHSCGFYKHKARDIVLACQMLLEKHDGKVPNSMEDLLALPGVGRKTANLLLGDLYTVPGSVVCDTHCMRICERLGLSKGREPEKVEKQLRAVLPRRKAPIFAIGSCFSAGKFALLSARNAANAPWRFSVRRSIVHEPCTFTEFFHLQQPFLVIS